MTRFNKIILSILIFFFSIIWENIFAYECENIPEWKIFYWINDDWNLWMLEFKYSENVNYTWDIKTWKTKDDAVSECYNIISTDSSLWIYWNKCEFTWTWIFNYFEFKDLVSSDFDELWNLLSCPYSLNETKSNLLISYDLNKGGYKTNLQSNTSSLSILEVMKQFSKAEDPLMNFDWKNLLLFWWIKKTKIDWNTEFSDYKLNLKIDFSWGDPFWYIYNSESIDSNNTYLWFEKNYIKKFDYISSQNTCEDKNINLIPSLNWRCLNWWWVSSNKVSLNCTCTPTPIVIPTSTAVPVINHTETNSSYQNINTNFLGFFKNLKCLFLDSAFASSCSQNVDVWWTCSAKNNTSNWIFRHNWKIVKWDEDDSYFFIWWKRIQDASSKNDEFLNDIWKFKTGEILDSYKWEFSKIDINDLWTDEKIIWWTQVDWEILILTASWGFFNIKNILEDTDNNWKYISKNIITDIDLWEFNKNFGFDINCNSDNKCKLVILWWSDWNIAFEDESFWQLNASKSFDKFSNEIKFFNFKKDTWGWSKDESVNWSGSITLNKKIFWYQDLDWDIVDEMEYVNPWIVRPVFYLNKNLDIYITSFDTAIYNKWEESERYCIQKNSEWFYLEEKNKDVVLLKNWEYWSWIVLPINWLNLNFQSSDNSHIPQITIPSLENNIFQYWNSSSFFLDKSRRILSCANNNWSNNVFIHKEGNVLTWVSTAVTTTTIASGSWDVASSEDNTVITVDNDTNTTTTTTTVVTEHRSDISTYLAWESFLPIEFKSWFENTDSKLSLNPIQSIKNNNEISFWWSFNSVDKKNLKILFKEEWTPYCKNSACSFTWEFIWFTNDFFSKYVDLKNNRAYFWISDHDKWKWWDKCLSISPFSSNWTCDTDSNKDNFEITFWTWSDLVKWSWLDFANIYWDNFEKKDSLTWSFLFSKKFSPWYHKIHMAFLSQPNMEDDDIFYSAALKWINWTKLHYEQSNAWTKNLSASDLNCDDCDKIWDSYKINYQAYVYEFYVPEISNIENEKISGENPVFAWKFIPKDSQLFFYSREEDDVFRLNDILKNYPITYTWYSLSWDLSDEKFSETSDRINNIVQLVDNSEMHHKIRPSANTWNTIWDFNYSPVLKFKKEQDNYLRYFYIDSKWNILWWKEKKFQTWTWENISFYNKTNIDNIIVSDSIRPFISWNYLSNKDLNISIIWDNKFIDNLTIKTSTNWNFTFQPQINLEKWKEYFLDFWLLNSDAKKIKILNNKTYPEIISHVNWEIEVAKNPIFFWNWFSWSTVKIEVFTENQKDLKDIFSEIKCKDILSSTWYYADLNNWKSFTWTSIYSCSDLGKKWNINIFSSWSVIVNSSWNWTWQLNKNLENTNSLDSKNIYFVKIYYENIWIEKNDENNYDLKSFRFFSESDSNIYPYKFKDENLDYIEENWDNVVIHLNNVNSSELEIFNKAEVEISSGSILDISEFGWINFLENQSNIEIEKWVLIYDSLSWKIKLNYMDQKRNFLQWDKIFWWAKKSKIKFSSASKIFSYWKVKIFPNTEKISIKFNKKIKFYLKNSDKINFWFFDKIFNYFSNNSIWKWYDTLTWWSEAKTINNYYENILTIFNIDKISSNKIFKLWDSFNWKIIQIWEKFLLKWTAWNSSKIKVLFDKDFIWSFTSDENWNFSFFIPKWFFYFNNWILNTNIKELSLVNNEDGNIIKTVLIELWDLNWDVWKYLNQDVIENKDRIFYNEKWFVNFSNKLKKLPEFFY